MKGGDSGPAIVIGDSAASPLIQAVRHTHATLKMPKRRAKLAEAEIAALARWVDSGAHWPDEKPPDASVKASERLEQQRSFWSLQPLADPPPPQVKDAAWPRGDIDRFVLARLEQEG